MFGSALHAHNHRIGHFDWQKLPLRASAKLRISAKQADRFGHFPLVRLLLELAA
jgi:hypothetical protein